jgi:V/A-type H+/Na+-transporting ATPase subunit K
MDQNRSTFKRKVAITLFFTMAVLIMLAVFPLVNVFAQSETSAPVTPEQAEVAKFGFLAAAVAFGFGAIGAGIGIANVGAAAMGAISEKPEIAGQALIFIALAEGLVVFGFITALIILGRV